MILAQLRNYKLKRKKLSTKADLSSETEKLNDTQDFNIGKKSVLRKVKTKKTNYRILKVKRN